MNRIFFIINSALFVCLIVSNTHKHDTQPVTTTTNEPLPFNNSLRGLQAAQVTPGVQVNSLPHPFNLNGSMPYQVWVNGERLPLNGDKANQIVELLDIGPFEQPKDTFEIHSGAGWLRPLPVQ